MQDLQNTIDEKEKRISYLEQQNEILSKIIHKDNKLIPAMELAVKEYISCPSQDKEKGNELLKELSEISQERYGIIEKYKNSGKKLPLTNVFSVDTTLNYMLNKSSQNSIEFNVCLTGDICFMTENIISETDLNTLLADLIENAIIATKLAETKQIIVNMGVLEDYYFIEIIDSGIPFSLETFNKLGKEKATTHQNDGGSGIGVLTTFDLLKKLNASFMINEFENNGDLHFTKKISVKFDDKHQCIVKSFRCDEIKQCCLRDDIIIEK